MIKKFFIISFSILITSCAVAQPDLPDTYFICEHKYDNKRDFMFESPLTDVTTTQSQECGILEIDGKCPIVIQVNTITRDTVTLSENEIENYTCSQQGIENETQ